MPLRPALADDVPPIAAGGVRRGALAYDMMYGKRTDRLHAVRRSSMARSCAMASACWSSRPPNRFLSGAACGRTPHPVFAELRAGLNNASARKATMKILRKLLLWLIVAADCHRAGNAVVFFCADLVVGRSQSRVDQFHAASTAPYCCEKNPKAQLQHKWVPYDRISNNLKRAIIASEDANFSEHDGVDWDALQKAYEKNTKKGKVVAGGSTITQQLAKNLFLSGERSYLRKGAGIHHYLHARIPDGQGTHLRDLSERGRMG